MTPHDRCTRNQCRALAKECATGPRSLQLSLPGSMKSMQRLVGQCHDRLFRDATWKVISGKILVGSGLHFSWEDLACFCQFAQDTIWGLSYNFPEADEPCENEAVKEENKDQSESTTPVHKKPARRSVPPSSKEFFGPVPEL